MKDLETEYRKQVESEVPDLWDRINASLDEEEKKAPKKKSKIVMVRFGEIAAVAACLVITAVVIRGRLLVRSDSAMESADVCYEATEAFTEAAESIYEAPKAMENAAAEPAATDMLEKAEVSADYETEVAPGTEETAFLPYDENDDGTFTYDGVTYQFKLELTGTDDAGENPVSVLILSNREDVTFEEVINTSEDTEDFVIISFY